MTNKKVLLIGLNGLFIMIFIFILERFCRLLILLFGLLLVLPCRFNYENKLQSHLAMAVKSQNKI